MVNASKYILLICPLHLAIMATQQSAEAKELSLVGKVEMRIALAETDEKLQSTLKTYLAPLLLKLASEHMSVRNKVCSRTTYSCKHYT